jgi:hypothetical protein
LGASPAAAAAGGCRDGEAVEREARSGVARAWRRRRETDAGLLRVGWETWVGLGEGRSERERRLAAAIARVCAR